MRRATARSPLVLRMVWSRLGDGGPPARTGTPPEQTSRGVRSSSGRCAPSRPPTEGHPQVLVIATRMIVQTKAASSGGAHHHRPMTNADGQHGDTGNEDDASDQSTQPQTAWRHTDVAGHGGDRRGARGLESGEGRCGRGDQCGAVGPCEQHTWAARSIAAPGLAAHRTISTSAPSSGFASLRKPVQGKEHPGSRDGFAGSGVRPASGSRAPRPRSVSATPATGSAARADGHAARLNPALARSDQQQSAVARALG